MFFLSFSFSFSFSLFSLSFFLRRECASATRVQSAQREWEWDRKTNVCRDDEEEKRSRSSSSDTRTRFQLASFRASFSYPPTCRATPRPRTQQPARPTHSTRPSPGHTAPRVPRVNLPGEEQNGSLQRPFFRKASGLFFFLFFFVNRRSDTDLGNTQSARWRESDCVLDRHGHRGWSPGDRMSGRDAHGQGRRTPGGRHVYSF